MSAAIPVFTRDRRFLAAVAELAPRVVPVGGPDGAVCVVSGRAGWWREAEATIDRGAVAVVLVEPGSTPSAGARDLAAAGRPVLVSRARLRSDVVVDATDALESTRLLVADVFAPPGELRAAVRDAVGWVRVLGGSTPRLAMAAHSGSAAIGALEGVDPVASIAVAVGGPGSRAAIDVIAAGTRRVEVRVEDAAATCSVTVTDSTGQLAVRTRFETVERVALRRALDALDRDEPVTDLADLVGDDAIAAVLTAGDRP